MISDNTYFSINDILKSLERKNKDLLFEIIGEPKKEEDLRTPIGNWLKDLGYEIEFEIPLPGAGRKRFIDIGGFKRGGLFTDDRIETIELKTTPSRSAIDSAFSQARDYQRCSDFTYVAVSPYLFLKYPEVIIRKAEDFYGIGVLLVDKFRVIDVLIEPKENDYDKDLWKEVRKIFIN